MNQTDGYDLTISRPRWYLGSLRRNQPWRKSSRTLNNDRSDDETIDEYQRESGEYSRRINPSNYTDRKRESQNYIQAKDRLNHSAEHNHDDVLPDLITEWREKVLSDQFKKDYFYKLKRLPVRLQRKLSGSRDRHHSHRQKSTLSVIVPKLKFDQGFQPTTIRSRTCWWSLWFFVSLTLVLAAGFIPLIIRLTKEKESSYVKYSLQLSTNQTFIDEYNNKLSSAFLAFTERFCSELDRCYQQSEYKDFYNSCFVDMLGQVSTSSVVNFDIYFKSSTIKQEKVISILKNCIDISRNSSYGNFGDFTIAMASIRVVSVTFGILPPNIKLAASSYIEITTTAIIDGQTSIVTSYSPTMDGMFIAFTRTMNQIVDDSSISIYSNEKLEPTSTSSMSVSINTHSNEEIDPTSTLSMPVSINTHSNEEIDPTSTLSMSVSINTHSNEEVDPTSTLSMPVSINTYSNEEIDPTLTSDLSSSISSDSNAELGQTPTLSLSMSMSISSGSNAKLGPSPTLSMYANFNSDSKDNLELTPTFSKFASLSSMENENLEPTLTLSMSTSFSSDNKDYLEPTATLKMLSSISSDSNEELGLTSTLYISTSFST